jgi:transposase
MGPDESSEALRDFVRTREAAKQYQTRARHRFTEFLLRSVQHPLHVRCLYDTSF